MVYVFSLSLCKASMKNWKSKLSLSRPDWPIYRSVACHKNTEYQNNWLKDYKDAVTCVQYILGIYCTHEYYRVKIENSIRCPLNAYRENRNLTRDKRKWKSPLEMLFLNNKNQRKQRRKRNKEFKRSTHSENLLHFPRNDYLSKLAFFFKNILVRNNELVLNVNSIFFIGSQMVLICITTQKVLDLLS